MFEAGYDENLAPGTWRRVISDGKTTARLACPKCGTSATLDDHEIDARGVVNPSLVCPASNPTDQARLHCDWHDHVTLVGWVSSFGVEQKTEVRDG